MPRKTDLTKSAQARPPVDTLAFVLAMGLLLGLALLKWGNPVIMAHWVAVPKSMTEWLYQPWPQRLAYGLIGLCAVLGWRLFRFQADLPRWLLWLPLLWLGWQFVSATQTVAPRLTLMTLEHFLACTALFYLGLFALSRSRPLSLFWLPVLAAFLMVLWIGFSQHYGGLEAMREYIYQETDWRNLPKPLLYKLGIKGEGSGERIFSTLFYPNTLAGVILLLGPVLAWFAWDFGRPLPRIARMVITGLVLYSSAACLYWSGSKAGWLIALGMLGLLFLHLPFARWLKYTIVIGVALVGIAGFSLKYADYFQAGAGSLAARFNYWEGAIATFQEHPWLGTGPGTFAVPFEDYKAPDEEMARLAHNDYLEQASDSGLLGFLCYAAWWVGTLIYLYPRCVTLNSPYLAATWLGLLGWAIQSLVEFGLYIPALAWPAFLLLGWLCGLAPTYVYTMKGLRDIQGCFNPG